MTTSSYFQIEKLHSENAPKNPPSRKVYALKFVQSSMSTQRCYCCIIFAVKRNELQLSNVI